MKKALVYGTLGGIVLGGIAYVVSVLSLGLSL